MSVCEQHVACLPGIQINVVLDGWPLQCHTIKMIKKKTSDKHIDVMYLFIGGSYDEE